jgi:hypothetical protein
VFLDSSLSFVNLSIYVFSTCVCVFFFNRRFQSEVHFWRWCWWRIYPLEPHLAFFLNRRTEFIILLWHAIPKPFQV